MIKTLQEVKKHQEAFLQKAKERVEPIDVEVNGLKITVNPGVFPPATDTKLLASHISVSPGDRIIDMTTGSGVIPVIAGLQGATGYAVDINPVAVQNARENIKKYQVDFTVIESNLFDAFPEEKFDVIFANGPFFEGDIHDPMDFACYGARSFMDGLLSQVKNRLKPDGKLFMVVIEWADTAFLEQTAQKYGLRAEIVDTRMSDDGERKYLLYEIKL